MTSPRCAFNRHCGEEPIGKGPDGQPYCFDHLGEALAEAERERAEAQTDRYGRNERVMRNARTL